MADKVLARFKASHSAQGMQLSAKQNGLLDGAGPIAVPPKPTLPSSDEEMADIA